LNIWSRWFLLINDLSYRIIRPLIFRYTSAHVAHERLLHLLQIADRHPILYHLARLIHLLTFSKKTTSIGNTQLPQPMILAAGFVKGHGFSDEKSACQAVDSGINIIPGWRSVPALLGLVEFGSFTRHPRTGNSGTVLWRDPATRSTQNRIGLKNPGALAAAKFLAARRDQLPAVFGINIAVSPGVDNPDIEERELVEALTIFLEYRIFPAWFTLNISCPNTEDDPSGNQTEAKTAKLCQAAIHTIAESGQNIPLWVKISPDLAPQQYHILMEVFARTGVAAVIATNTIGQPTPDRTQTAGVGGGRLHAHALAAVKMLLEARHQHNAIVDIIACGGILDADSRLDFKALGVSTYQYWSALVYRGPLAPAIIESESI
jgi:dihydroorotate dehydrogenase